MPNVKVGWWSPDKIIKDIIWDDVVEASQYARGRLLDVGCGTKPYLSIFAEIIDEYVGIDNKSDSADIKKDFLKITLKEKSFHTVLCTQVIEHVSHPELLLKKIYEVLNKGGYVILTAPFVGSLHEEPTDFYRFTKYSLENLFEETGFKVVYIKEEGNWISSISNLTCFYLEGTMNKHLLRYPKKVLLIFLQTIFYLLSKLPERFTKPKNCPMNYIVVAKK